jgi:glutaredoxin
MKKLIILAVLVFAGYKFYQNGFSVMPAKGAFDKQGKPLVVLFVGPGCGAHCERIQTALNERGVAYEEINVVEADGKPAANKYGINRFPTTLIGKHEVLGDDIMRITAALAETYGKEVLTRMESMAMENHFDTGGRAKVVMYATKWCSYCKKQREYFAANNIPYEEIDVEASRSNELLYNALQGTGYPLTYVGYRRFSGYNEGPIVTAMKELEKARPAR